MIAKANVEQAYNELHDYCGGVRNDYFGLLYLEDAFRVPRDQAKRQIAFGGHDYGIDGFHLDEQKRNLYLFQFKYSQSYEQFRPSMKRLIDDGVERVFAATDQDPRMNPFLLELMSCLFENQAVIDRVYFLFVFTGEPEDAERSLFLDKLREDLEGKHYLLSKYFSRPVSMIVEYRSAQRRMPSPRPKVQDYQLDLTERTVVEGPNGEQLHTGFVGLAALHGIYRAMGQRFLDRNIRGALPEERPVNRALENAFRRIILDRVEAPGAFAFNHNGVALAAEAFEHRDGEYHIIEPRVLNGAQTLAAFGRFLKLNDGNPRLAESASLLRELRVLCKIITNAAPSFVTTVTINNNRQNAVAPWNLRANDEMQLLLADKFRDELNLYYERQEGAFAGLSDEDLRDEGVVPGKAVQLLRLARTFIVCDGEIAKLSNLNSVFAEDRQYNQVFSESRLRADLRKLLLCYKVQFRLARLTDAITDKYDKYRFLRPRGRHLLWALLSQGVLNDDTVDDKALGFGTSLVMEADFTEWLWRIATARCRFLLSDLIAEEPYRTDLAQGHLELRTNRVYQTCMGFARSRWGWSRKSP